MDAATEATDLSPLQSLRIIKKRGGKMRGERLPVLALPAPTYGKRVKAMGSTATASAPSPVMDKVAEVENHVSTAGDSCFNGQSFHFLDKETGPLYYSRKRNKSASKMEVTAAMKKKGAEHLAAANGTIQRGEDPPVTLSSPECLETHGNLKKRRKISRSGLVPAPKEMASDLPPAIGIPEAMKKAHPDNPSSHFATSTSIKVEASAKSAVSYNMSSNENAISSSTMSATEQSLLSSRNGSISRNSLELFENMLKSFVYIGKERLQHPVPDAAASKGHAILSSNGKMASSCCPGVPKSPDITLREESGHENRFQRPICSLDKMVSTFPIATTRTSAFKHESSICTTFTYVNIGVANPTLATGQEDEACSDLSESTLKKVKRKHQSALISSPCSVLTHGAASQQIRRQRRIVPVSSGNDEAEVQELMSCKRPKTMTKAEKMQDAYRRVSPDNEWIPPHSPYELLQEDHAYDPWRVLVICMLLNQTSGTQVKQVLEKLFRFCPNAKAAAQARKKALRKIIKPLGLQNKRVKDIQEMSRQYLEDWWTHVTQLHGVGKYAADAYAIFCVGKPEDIIPDDHKLVDYWNYVVKWRCEQQFLVIGMHSYA